MDHLDNKAIADIWGQPALGDLILYRLGSRYQDYVLLGNLTETAFLKYSFTRRGQNVTCVAWDWDSCLSLHDAPNRSGIIVCKIPAHDHHWEVLKQLKDRFGSRVLSIYEYVLPFTAIGKLQASLANPNDCLKEIVSYYIDQRYSNTIDKLNTIFPLRGKNVIEIGASEGYHTAGLVKAGTQKITCIEVRAENFIKAMVAGYALGWENVSVVLDDFHSANTQKYGRYDLALASGVYYHSTAPFVLFDNLLSLSDNVFLGGFCVTDSLPEKVFDLLEYGAQSFRVKKYKEENDCTSGVNGYGYFFHRDDLVRFFSERECVIDFISEEEKTVTDGNVVLRGTYIRFLARRN
jgi:hypothetical protein